MTGAGNGADERHLPQRLASDLAAAGLITSPVWRQAFEAVPRHLFVPQAAIAEIVPGQPTSYRLVADSATPARRSSWLEAVYSDVTLITQIGGQPVAEALADSGETGGWATSSSTAPGLMAWLLEALDLQDGDRVLEIGTGTGYNAALLCQRLGARNVTSVDIDPQLTAAARTRLASLGHHPALASADGRHGYPADAPYDRIIATTSWPYLPPAWLTQVKPGGLIVANIAGLLGGAMLLARVTDDGTATGGFHPRWAGFMTARGAVSKLSDITPADTDEGSYDTGTTRLDPAVLDDPAMAFVAQLNTGDARPYWGTHEDGRDLYGLISQDGSWAEIYPPGPAGDRYVEQGGRRRLWTLVEAAHAFWQANGKPDWSRYGFTATSSGQFAWFERRYGVRWELPVPETPDSRESRHFERRSS